MIAKHSKPQWIFSGDKESEMSIGFGNPDHKLWIQTEGGETRVRLYDYLAEFLYEVSNHHDPEGALLGWMRPMVLQGDGYEVLWEGTFWMREGDKERMLRLLRKIISFRSAPMPEKYFEVWTVAFKIVQNLDLFNPGKSVS